MRKRLIREKKFLFIKIISVFLLISFAVSGIYIYITYNSQKELLLSQARSNFGEVYDGIFYDYIEYDIGKIKKSNNEIYAYDEYDNKIANTDNRYFCNFCGERSEGNIKKFMEKGFIDFNSFRRSMADEQYNEIVGMISHNNENSPDKKGNFYQLVCTEFYTEYPIFDNEEDEEYGKVYEILPKKVAVVSSRDINVWHAQDKIVKEFELKPDNTDKHNIYKINGTSRNEISSDFVMGDFKFKDLRGQLIDAMEYNWIENPTQEVLQKVAPFTYTYYNKAHLYTEDTDNAINIYSFDSGEKYTNNIVSYSVSYFERFNVIESCIGSIGIVFVYTLIMFLLIGILMWLMMWHTVKRQTEFEQKRRDTANAMAHDLKTPLFIITGNAENLIECCSNDEQRYYAQNIISKVRSVNELVHDMLDLSSMEAQKLSLNIEKYDFSEQFDEILQSRYDVMELCNIHIEKYDNVFINADKRLIRRAVENLVDNALKYTDDKSSVAVRLDMHSFSISNSIPKNIKLDVKRIFEPYKRFDNSSGKDGNGLGLSIVHSVLEMHRFKYEISAKNSKFIFKFIF